MRVQLRGAALVLRAGEVGLGEFRRFEELRVGLDALRLRLEVCGVGNKGLGQLGVGQLVGLPSSLLTTLVAYCLPAPTYYLLRLQLTCAAVAACYLLLATCCLLLTAHLRVLTPC